MNWRTWAMAVGMALSFTSGPLFAQQATAVRIIRLPEGGYQPQTRVDAQGRAHVVYLVGPADQANVQYARSDDGKSWSPPVTVNSTPGSAVGMGTIRGPRLALGRDREIHIAWNGSGSAAGLWYTRSTDGGVPFEPQRNLLGATQALDGGCALAADARGNVAVVWHANRRGEDAEEQRRVWAALSSDGGATFAPEQAVNVELTGACACCQVEAAYDAASRLRVIYRGAAEGVHRDEWLLTQTAPETWQQRLLDRWELAACPMTTADIVSSGDTLYLAWETQRQVYWATLDTKSGELNPPHAAPGEGGARRFPSLAVLDDGRVLLAWTHGVGWGTGGEVHWQVYGAHGKPLPADAGKTTDLPAWGFVAAAALAGECLLIY